MVEVSATVPAPPEAVFEVLADGWSYSGWVVGSCHIRDVDASWPQVGARIHHSVGGWPLQLEDTTAVLAVEPGASLELEARGGALGTARIELSLVPDGAGETTVRMAERVTGGMGALLPERVQALVLGPRNRESLARLSALASGRWRGTGEPSGQP
ncbi:MULTISPECIES: SRPBCC family protein [Amycolatopsis]|uniref:SRPBCC family protein n=1 Tax=Amycolatopsis dendrobii TaxID=2760662 RepID=A0A7W3ZEC2_9PSEU|nr:MULTISPECIES: SRPBCC family protein [Amycolatopsis]MBB1158355.1 SRPBCC family protein [Amycolatopsis dendrobii]UKD56857.1 SRPBCC family protein [Amycolatopsis sp. FU40]